MSYHMVIISGNFRTFCSSSNTPTNMFPVFLKTTDVETLTVTEVLPVPYLVIFGNPAAPRTVSARKLSSSVKATQYGSSIKQAFVSAAIAKGLYSSNPSSLSNCLPQPSPVGILYRLSIRRSLTYLRPFSL